MLFSIFLPITIFLGLLVPHGVNGQQDDSKKVYKISQSIPGASIEYQKTSICETTSGVDSYSGYVHLSSSSIPDLQGDIPYNISTFFWYFSARKDPQNAPTAIYLAGGPGEASSFSALGESGPCYANKDSKSTTLNDFSFNNEVNMLYIDQPNQVGFSYDNIVDGVFDVLTGNEYNQTIPANLTVMPGKFASQNPQTIANTTGLAAKALWHFTQVWLAEFEGHHCPENKLSVWGNSYGGFWTIATFIYFQDQNAKLANGTLDASRYRSIQLDTVGITNGCIDLEASVSSYVTLPINNTYDVQLLNQTVYDATVEALNGPGGCMEQVHKCRTLQAESDPGAIGINVTVNGVCSNATQFCIGNVLNPFIELSEVNQFDIGSPKANPFPPNYPWSFLNQEWVREALGVPKELNYTGNSNAVQQLYFQTGDFIKRSIADLNSLLDHGVNVAMIYGDRDWKCSWIGAENVSLSASYHSSSSFRSAGYSNITTNATYTGGVVRQYEGFSFSRVFDAGHAVSFYQPETTLQIFNRVMFKKDVATGKVGTEQGSNYTSAGPSSSWGFKNKLPGPVPNECSIWNVIGSCSQTQFDALQNGTAKVENFIVVQPAA